MINNRVRKILSVKMDMDKEMRRSQSVTSPSLFQMLSKSWSTQKFITTIILHHILFALDWCLSLTSIHWPPTKFVYKICKWFHHVQKSREESQRLRFTVLYCFTPPTYCQYNWFSKLLDYKIGKIIIFLFTGMLLFLLRIIGLG